MPRTHMASGQSNGWLEERLQDLYFRKTILDNMICWLERLQQREWLDIAVELAPLKDAGMPDGVQPPAGTGGGEFVRTLYGQFFVAKLLGVPPPVPPLTREPSSLGFTQPGAPPKAQFAGCMFPLPGQTGLKSESMSLALSSTR